MPVKQGRLLLKRALKLKIFVGESVSQGQARSKHRWLVCTRGYNCVFGSEGGYRGARSDWPVVLVRELGSFDENGLALGGQVGGVGELVAVEFDDATVLVFFGPLTHEAVLGVFLVQRDLLNQRSVVNGKIHVSLNLQVCLLNECSVSGHRCFDSVDAHLHLQYLKAKRFNGNNLVGVDVELFFINGLVGGGRLHVKGADGAVKVSGRDRVNIGLTEGGSSED